MKNYKKDFPIFNNKSLVYLDSAATSQKPQIVIDAIRDYYENYNSNVRRGLYRIAEKATEKVEETRVKVAKFINAKDPSEIIFTRNTTEAINLVSYSMSQNIKRGNSVVSTIMEHHSNFVPWQQLVKNKIDFKVLDFSQNYQFPITNFQSIFNSQKTKLLAITHVSNVLGVINPIREIIKEVKKINSKILVLVDAAQSVPHMKVDVQDLNCDFLAFSGHKMMAGTGIGVLYGKKEVLSKMQPFLYGSDMIKEVAVKTSAFLDIPNKFEAGTPDICGIISLGKAVDYLENIGMENVRKHEGELTRYCLNELEKIKDIAVYGPKNLDIRLGVISFNIKKIHPHDMAQILGDMALCIRAGHHCAMPLHKKLGISASARVSFYLYNDDKDIDRFIKGIKKVQRIFKL